MQHELIRMQMRPGRQVGLKNGADEVLFWTPFDPLVSLADQVHFPSNLLTWLFVPLHACACARACEVERKSHPHRKSVFSLSCVFGKAVGSMGTLPLWAFESLWGVTGQLAEEATSCEM